MIKRCFTTAVRPVRRKYGGSNAESVKSVGLLPEIYAHEYDKLIETLSRTRLAGPGVVATEIAKQSRKNGANLKGYSIVALKHDLENSGPLAFYVGRKWLGPMLSTSDDTYLVLFALARQDRVEELYDKYQELRTQSDMSALPYNAIVALLCEYGCLAEVYNVLEDAVAAKAKVAEKEWNRFIQLSVLKHDIEAASFGCSNVDLSALPDPLLLKVSELAALEKANDLLESVTEILINRHNSSFSNNESGYIVMTALINKTYSAEDVFRAAVALAHTISVRDIPMLEEEVALNARELNGPALTLAMNFDIRQKNQFSSRLEVLSAFREFRNVGAIPNADTLDLLAAAVHRQRNSKKLSYLIFQECMKYDIEPSRHVFEAFLRIAATGTNYDAVIYWLKLMKEHNVELRRHIHIWLKRRFDEIDSQMYVNYLHKTILLETVEFPTDEELKQSSGLGNDRHYDYKKDMRHCQRFLAHEKP